MQRQIPICINPVFSAIELCLSCRFLAYTIWWALVLVRVFQTLMSVQNRQLVSVLARTPVVWTLPAHTSASANTALWPHAGQTYASVAELGNLSVSLCFSCPKYATHTVTPHTLYTHFHLSVQTWDWVYAVNLKKHALTRSLIIGMAHVIEHNISLSDTFSPPISHLKK